MIKSVADLFEAFDSSGLPANLRRVWNSDVPKRVKHIIQDPTSLFHVFVSYPEAFPSSDELLILWQTNGESIVGYLLRSRKFIRYYLEDGPEKFQVLGYSYQQMISELFAQLLMRGVEEQELELVVKFLDFRYLEPLRDFITNNPEWEENTAPFIARIESGSQGF